MPPQELAQKIKAHAKFLGVFHTGIAKAEKPDGAHLDEWLQCNYHGDMAYMQNCRDMRIDPASLAPGAKSIIVCAMNYYAPFETTSKPDEGCISRYAWGDDYHDVLRARLKALLAFIQEQAPGSNGRVFVDSAPVMEKEWVISSLAAAVSGMCVRANGFVAHRFQDALHRDGAFHYECVRSYFRASPAKS